MAPNPRLIIWRLATLIVGVAVLFWLPFEDVNDRFVQTFALSICSLAAVRWMFTRTAKGFQMQQRTELAGVLFLMLTGLGFGLLVGPASVFLMVLKSGLHGHPTPDFNPGQVWVVLQNTPLWAGIGSLAGLAAGLLRLARRR